ncbi:phage tail tip lysozyme [Methylobacterium phyllosphaerae]
MLTIAELAARDGVSKPTVSIAVKKLIERAGLTVERDAQGRVARVNAAEYDHLRGRYGDPSKAQAPARADAPAADPPPTAPIKAADGYDEALRQKTWIDAETRRLDLNEKRGNLVRRDRVTEAVGAGIMMPINLVPGTAGGGGGGGGGLIQRASFGGGEGGLDGMIRRGGLGGGEGGGGGGGGGLGGVRIGGGSGRGGGGFGGGAYDGNYTGNDGRRAARGRMSADGAANVASWMEFFRRPVDQGGMGYTEEQARGQIAMMQGESGLNLDPASKGDHNRAGVPQSFGTVQWNRAAGRFGKLQALAQSMGKDWTDRGVQQQMYRQEMMGAYRGVYDRIRRAQTGEQSLGAGISGYENPKHHDLAYAIRKPFLDRLRRGGVTAAKPGDGEPRLVKGLDGKEGLDLGNGTMKMPDGSIRSIIPAAPVGGIGGGGGRAGLQAAADRMHAAAERFEQASFHGQIEVVASGGMRPRGMRIKSRGAVTADMGVSMPGAKESDDDWT